MTRRFASGRGGGLALLILCLVVYLPGQRTLPPVDRDESRFAQASRQMAESEEWGGWVVPKIQNRPRLNKPPLIYWAQASAVRVFGDRGRLHEGIWVYRLPSLLAAVATVFLTWRLGLSMFDPRAAWLGAGMLAASPVFVWEAHQARADQVLVTTVVATQFVLWRIWRSTQRGCPVWVPPSPAQSAPLSSPEPSPRRRAPLVLCVLFWLCFVLGILAKGPITPMIAGLTILTLSVAMGRWRWLLDLRPLLGLMIVTAGVGPWVYLVAQQVGWSDYLQTVYRETFGRAGAAMEGHWGPPGYHLAVLVVLFWPGTLLTASAVVGALSRAVVLPPRTRSPKLFARLREREIRRGPELFLLAWILPAWLVFELVSTKLPHYTMPLYPAIALLSARAVVGAASRRKPRGLGDTLGLYSWFAVGLVLAVGVPVGIAYSAQSEPGVVPIIATLAGIAATTLLVVGVRTQLIVRTQVTGILAASVALCCLIGLVLPSTPKVWISSRLMEALHAADPGGGRPIGLAGYHEDSMIFLSRGRAVRLEEEAVLPWLAEFRDGLVVVPRHRGDQLPAQLRELAHVNGFNYSTGRNVALTVAERRSEAGSEEGAPLE